MTARKYANLYKASSQTDKDEAATNKAMVQELIKALQGKIKDPELARKAAEILSEWVNKSSSK